jgi:hypothetical protein
MSPLECLVKAGTQIGRCGLSSRELTRVEVMGRLKAGSLCLQEAAELLELSYPSDCGHDIAAKAAGGCSMATAGASPTDLTRKSFGRRCWSECELAIATSGRRWPSIWRKMTNSKCTQKHCGCGCALEEPELLVEDIRLFFRGLRTAERSTRPIRSKFRRPKTMQHFLAVRLNRVGVVVSFCRRRHVAKSSRSNRFQRFAEFD